MDRLCTALSFCSASLLLAALLCACTRAGSAADTNLLRTYEVKISPKDLAHFEANGYSNETVPVTFVADGNTYEHARLRTRGDWARGWPKKSLKIFFEKEHQFEH